MRAMLRQGIKQAILFLALAHGGHAFLYAQWLAGFDRTDPDGCTIGVASGRATPDGRPMIWKTRDTDAPNNEARWCVAQPHSYVGVFNAGGESPWMAVNERGFALLNANSLDLPGPGNSGNGLFMRQAMAECATVADFQRLLDSTNVSGRRTKANFAVLDSTGAAAMFETGGWQYWKYDATDGSIAEGYVIRTNFALRGGGSIGYSRYIRSRTIVAALRAVDSLTPRGLFRAQMRDFADAAGNPFPVPFRARAYPGIPFGYIETSASICGATSVSAVVIQGVRKGEPAQYSTMWTMLGLPAASIAVPYWPVGPTPQPADGTPASPLCDEANRLQKRIFRYLTDPITGRVQEYVDSYVLRDPMGHGIWPQIIPAEENIAADAEHQLRVWRANPDLPPIGEMLAEEARLAEYACNALRAVTFRPDEPAPEDTVVPLYAWNYPNPCNSGTRIRFSLPAGGRVRVELFDILGRGVATVLDDERQAGMQDVFVDAGGLATGVYWYRLSFGDATVARKLMVIR